MYRELSPDAAPATLRDRLGPVMRRFSHSDRAETVLSPAVAKDLRVITGFGPTNTPTAGTLSVMLGVIELQRRLNAPMTVVVSELGAWNSRNVPWTQLEAVRDQMCRFLRHIGLDETQTLLRSHLDFDNLVRAGKISRYLSREDFLTNSESLLELYDSHGLLGSELGITVDSLYTVANLLGPAEYGIGHILTDESASQSPLLSAIELASGWEEKDLDLARISYYHRAVDPKTWRQLKQRYLDTFVSYADQWRQSTP